MSKSKNEGKSGNDGRVNKKSRKDNNMNLHTIVNGHWMITSQMLDTIQGIYLRHLNNDNLTKAEIHKILGGEVDNDIRNFLITENGTAIIPIQGVVAKKMNLLHDISGGASSELIQTQLREALGDNGVKSIILDINSPGGTVEGAFELADFIFESRSIKPIVAFSDGMMTSAAFLFGSATNRIITSSQLVEVGGIGIITQHVDISKAEEMEGYKTTVLYSGKFKAVGNQHAPLSRGDEEIIQGKLDFMYTHFVHTVAKFRNTNTETVANNMAEGRTFMGDQAIEAGLVDQISTLDDLILDMPNQGHNPGNFININNPKEVRDMKIENMGDLKKECPELVKTLSEDVSVGAVADFKKSSEYLALEEKAKKAEVESTLEGDNSNAESLTIAKLKSDLDGLKVKLKDNDKKFFAIQMSNNKNKSDKVFSDALGNADYSEKVQNKILSNKPDFEKHLCEEGNLKVDSYTEACKKEVDSWAGIMENVDQDVGLDSDKGVEGEASKKEVSAYSSADTGKW